MAALNVYFAGQEDIDFIFYDNFTISTTGRRTVGGTALSRSSFGLNTNVSRMLNAVAFAQANFWWSAYASHQATAASVTNAVLWELRDVNGIVRIQCTTTSAGTPQTYKVEKVTAAGVRTSLFTGTINWIAATATQFAMQIVYSATGSINFYYNQVLIGSVAATDVTTDGITSLSYVGWGFVGASLLFWTEMIVCDQDPRTFSLQTFAPVANGNTHNFDTGTPAAANVNEVTLDRATLDGSTTAGQIDEYTNAAVVTGTFSVLAFGISSLMQKGATGPAKADMVVRTGGTDFFSPDIPLTAVWADYQYWWNQNPNTSADWQTTQIGATAGFNIGIKSVT